MQGEAQCFAVRRGELDERLDANYYQPLHATLETKLTSSRYPSLPLGELLREIVGGATPHLADAEQYAESGIRFLRILNVCDGEIVADDMKYIAPEVHNGLLRRSRLRAGDVLMSITGRVGNAAVVPDSLPPANINQHLVAMRLAGWRCDAEFLVEWLNSPSGLALTNRQVSGGSRVALDYERIRDLCIPLPPLDKQRELTAAMEAAREARRAKLAEADALLAGLDAYLLEALGLALTPASKRHVFAMSTASVRAHSRLGPDYFSPERVLAIRAMQNISTRMPCVQLSDVVAFVRDQVKTPGRNYIGLAGVQSQTGELSGVDEEAEGACFLFRRGDVLFARLRPYLNKVWSAEVAGCCSPEFHVLRINDAGSLKPDYLAAALRSSLILAQTRHMMTGNTHPRLANEDVVNLMVPIPDEAIQSTIATEVRRRRERVRTLRAEAEVGWAEAKRWFEEQLLGPVP